MRVLLVRSLSRFRPWNSGVIAKIGLAATLFSLFLAADYILFRRLFRAAAQIEAITPFFALGLIENFLGMVFLVALITLFFSSLTSAIGSFFADLDLEIYHASPMPRWKLLVSRWAKTYVFSSHLVISFLLPMFFAFAAQYDLGAGFLVAAVVNLLLLLAIPVSLSCSVILLLVRFFPVRRVHQIAATLGILFMTLVIVGIRVARPERLFTKIDTDDVVTVLQAIQLPAPELYPSTWIATMMTGFAENSGAFPISLKIAVTAVSATLVFIVLGILLYFDSFVRAKETSSPVAIGARPITSLLDRLTGHLEPQMGTLIRKEVRMITRDAAQWSQLFMMVALLFLYLYNIQMMPLEGDARAALLAYFNLAMSGFVVSAICLRFAYPAVSAEGKQFWVVASAPVSMRRLLWSKAIVFLLPLLFVSLLLTTMANLILKAAPEIWYLTMTSAFLTTATLVALGVGMGGISANFKLANPLEVSLSLGGFTYMAISMLYVGLMMFLFARPFQRFFYRVILGVVDPQGFVTTAIPVVIAVGISAVLSILPVELARHRLSRQN